MLAVWAPLLDILSLASNPSKVWEVLVWDVVMWGCCRLGCFVLLYCVFALAPDFEQC